MYRIQTKEEIVTSYKLNAACAMLMLMKFANIIHNYNIIQVFNIDEHKEQNYCFIFMVVTVRSKGHDNSASSGQSSELQMTVSMD